MRLSWCRARAISPKRPQWIKRALRQTWRGRRQSSHWLHRFFSERQSCRNEGRQDSSAKLWSKCAVLNLSACRLFGDLRGAILFWESSREIMLFVYPKPRGNFFAHLSLIDQARNVLLLQHLTGVCFHSVEWITAGCMWDYYHKLCEWANRLLKSAHPFRIRMSSRVGSWLGSSVVASVPLLLIQIRNLLQGLGNPLLLYVF